MNEHEIMNVKETAAYLRCSTSTLYRLLHKGGLPGWRVGADWRFTREDIDRWRLEQQTNVGR